MRNKRCLLLELNLIQPVFDCAKRYKLLKNLREFAFDLSNEESDG